EEFIPLLALKNMVMFPGIIIPVTIGRDKSIQAVSQAYTADKYIAVSTQRQLNVEDPMPEDLYEVGVVAKIIRLIRMPDGSSTAILQGRKRFKLEELVQTAPLLKAKISVLSDIPAEDSKHFTAMT